MAVTDPLLFSRPPSSTWRTYNLPAGRTGAIDFASAEFGWGANQDVRIVMPATPHVGQVLFMNFNDLEILGGEINMPNSGNRSFTTQTLAPGQTTLAVSDLGNWPTASPAGKPVMFQPAEGGSSGSFHYSGKSAASGAGLLTGLTAITKSAGIGTRLVANLNVRTAIFLYDYTGIVHLEGLWIHGDCIEGVNVNCRNLPRAGATLRTQLCRIELAPKYPEFYASGPGATMPPAADDGWENHADILQPYQGPNRIEIDKLTGYTPYQGVYLEIKKPQSVFDVNAWWQGGTVSRVNMVQPAVDKGHAMIETYDTVVAGRVDWRGPFYMKYVSTGRSFNTNYGTGYMMVEAGYGTNRPGPALEAAIAAGRILIGTPPEGDYAKVYPGSGSHVGYPGIGYISPGYLSADTTPPAAPTGFGVTAPGPNAAKLAWTAPVAADLHHYEVWRRLSTGGYPASPIASPVVPATTYTDPGLTEGVGYVYRVRAVDQVGNRSAYTAEVAFTAQPPPDTVPPPVPGPPVLQLSNGDVQVTWPPVSAGDLAGYELYRRKNAAGSLEVADRTVAQGRSYLDTDVIAGDVVRYKVRSYDQPAGNRSGFSAEVSITVVDAGDVPPEAPVIDIGAAAQGAIVIGWGEYDPAPDVTGYLIHRRAVPGSYPAGAYDSAASRGYVDDQVAIGTDYGYRIAAVDAAGNVSPLSPEFVVEGFELERDSDDVMTLAVAENTTTLVAAAGDTELDPDPPLVQDRTLVAPDYETGLEPGPDERALSPSPNETGLV